MSARSWILSMFLASGAVASAAPRPVGPASGKHVLLASDEERAKLSPSSISRAIRTFGLQRAALRRDFVAQHDDVYDVELAKTPIRDQQKSGRCAIYTGVGMMEEDYFLRTGERTQASRAYVGARNLQAKAYASLFAAGDASWEGLTADSIHEGADPDTAMRITEQFGAYPEHVIPDRIDAKASATALRLLQTTLARAHDELSAVERGGPESSVILERTKKAIDSILARAYTGQAKFPEKFKVDGIWYTPKTWGEKLGAKADDYVTLEVTKNKRIGWHAVGSNVTLARRYNVADMSILKEAVAATIDQRRRVYVSLPIGDAAMPFRISSKEIPGLPAAHGIYSMSAFDFESIGLPSATVDRALNEKHGLHPDNHAMTVEGYARRVKGDKTSGFTKWKIENTHGTKAGDGGYEHVYDDVFSAFVGVVTVPRSALTPEFRAHIEQQEKATQPSRTPE